PHDRRLVFEGRPAAVGHDPATAATRHPDRGFVPCGSWSHPLRSRRRKAATSSDARSRPPATRAVGPAPSPSAGESFAAEKSMRTLTSGPPSRRLHRSGRRAPVIPLLPVAYRGSYVRRLLAPRRPVERALLSVIQQTYLAGTSTRTVDALAETVGVPGTNPAVVDAQARDWDRRVDAFRHRRLRDGYPYLMLFERTALVREADDAL